MGWLGNKTRKAKMCPRIFGFACCARGLQVTSRSCPKTMFHVLFACHLDSLQASRFACLGKLIQEAAVRQGDLNHLLCRQQLGV